MPSATTKDGYVLTYGCSYVFVEQIEVIHTGIDENGFYKFENTERKLTLSLTSGEVANYILTKGWKDQEIEISIILTIHRDKVDKDMRRVKEALRRSIEHDMRKRFEHDEAVYVNHVVIGEN